MTQKNYTYLFILLVSFMSYNITSAQTIPVGSGSYTKTFPGIDVAGRNGYPSGSPQLSGNAIGKPVPTNDWWSKLVKEDHADNLFNYPFAMKTLSEGLIASYLPWGVYGDHEPFVIGLEGLSASRVTISDYSDWTATLQWKSSSHTMEVTAGIGMPFLYFTKDAESVLKIKVNTGTVSISNEMLLIVDAASGADFAFYAPTGSTWEKNGQNYTSTLNGKTYWSMAMLPQANTNPTAIANDYKKYAYVFPKNTSASWKYNEKTSVLKTDFVIETEVKERSDTTMLIGLLPHQWNNLSADAPALTGKEYTTVRGKLKTMASNRFSVENTFHGILPTLPYLANYSDGFNLASMNEKIKAVENDGLATWTDSYNEGQVMNRLIQVARIADLMGNTASRDKMLATIKARLEDWLTYQSGEKAFLFYYNTTWSAMLGYPAGHGQDSNINDHHFHWGYFIHAAAFLEQFEPGWANKWGEMINHLVQDAASPSRTNEKYPFLRNYSPYAGHCWANGFASFPQGNDQESTSESMQFNSSLIHWGAITGNKEIRDLGIYLYTTEQTAIEEYWFDMYERNFKPDQQYSLVSRVWGNSYDNGTFWTSDIAASYGIEMYPIHGGSLYLGQNTAYVTKLWDEITKNTGILQNEENPNLWHDVMWKYLAFIDPAKAIKLYDSYPERNLKFGISDAQTYYWLHAMNALGEVDASITADYPIAAVFKKGNDKTYTAHNYTAKDMTVHFSDGFNLEVPAKTMVTNKDVDIKGSLTSSFASAYINGSVDLLVQVSGGTATKVAFFDGNDFVGERTSQVFSLKADSLAPGVHNFYAKVYDGTVFSVTNISTVVVGQQLPYLGMASAIPGTFEAGNYDKFEGGLGQGIAYNDVSANNAGDYRLDQYVDAVMVTNEGATIGWISGGEWLEYTVEVAQSGMYDLSFRYACGNASGGGPFHMEMDGKPITGDISVTGIGNDSGWRTWKTKTVNNLALVKGKRVIKIAFQNGELNLGKCTFTYKGELGYNQPVANAGGNKTVVLPETSTALNGSTSESPGGIALGYQWTQIYGPSKINFDNATSATPLVSNLEQGIYSIALEVSNGTYSDKDEMLLIVSTEDNLAPTVYITSPKDNSTFKEGVHVAIVAAASDLDGSIQKVEFYEGNKWIATKTDTPYEMDWVGSEGTYSITAVATDDKGKSTTSEAININLTGQNIALNKSVTTSSNENGGTPGKLAVDGDEGTRWSSAFADPQWVQVDLGANYQLKEVVLKWEAAFGQSYEIQVSDNGTSWTNVFTENAGDGETDDIKVNAKGRYVRMYGKTRGTPYGYSLFEFEVYGSSITAVQPVEENQIAYYPNPVSDVLTLENMKVGAHIRLYNISGNLAFEQRNSLEKVQVDMQSFDRGIYIVEVLYKNQRINFKVVKN